MQTKVTFWRRMAAILLMISAATISGKVMAEPSTTPATASEQKSDPVIFWAHYMPMIPHGHQHAHPHNGGNLDSWPLNSQMTSSIEEQKEDIRQALASGINGFQMLTYGAPEMCQAAKEIYQETGEMFYVAPEWCWSSSPKNTDEAIANIAAFALAHQNNPHVYKEKGRQIHFFYGGGLPWKNNQALLNFKQKLAEKGVDVLLAPTIYDFDRVALDQPDVRGKSGDLPVLSATTRWLKETALEAATDFAFGVRPEWGGALDQKLKEAAPGFLWIPSLGSGYDSSNRPGQAIHAPFHGVRNLWDTFQFWMKLGYRKYSYITWNDCLESLLIPSSRNVWGYNTITRYFHDVIETGKSSFKTPQVVVSYPVDCLVGDQFFMQFLVLPAGNEKLEVRAAVELNPVGGGKKVVLRSEGASSPDSLPVFLEARKGTGEWMNMEAFRPVVTVEIKNTSTGEWEKLHDRIRLGMTRVRYNIVQFPVNYAVNLDWVDSKTSLSFAMRKVGRDSTLFQGTVQASASSPIRRLMLMDRTMSLGTFRNVDDQGKEEKEKVVDIYRDLFLRLEVSELLPVRLSIENGLIHDLYSPGPNLDETVESVNANSARFSVDPNKEFRSCVARVDLSKHSRITFSLDGKPGSDSLSVALNDLGRGVVAKTIVLDGKKVTLGMALTTDATDPNIDYALPQQGKYKRYVPLNIKPCGVRVLQTMAWLKSGKIAYSNLSLLRAGSPSAQENTVAQWIDTGGTFDDFVDGGSSISLNPFTPGMVKTSSIPKSKIPYFHLDFEEGAGARLNDHGTSHELGRAWFTYNRSDNGHMADYNPEKNGHYQWVEGVRGKGIQLAENTWIHFRSKSSPIGAETVSVWVHLSERNGAEQSLRSALSVPPFKLELSGERQGSVSFQRAGVKAQVPPFKGLHPGWNHLVFCYDLGSVTVYLDGKQVTLAPNVNPAYQRTHESPYFGFSNKSGGDLGFDGQLDEVEVIGTGLDASEVEKLWQGKAWRDSK